jgi:hypothetical protein
MSLRQRVHALKSRHHKRAKLYDAASLANDLDGVWRHLTAMTRLYRKIAAARDKARLRGEDWE